MKQQKKVVKLIDCEYLEELSANKKYKLAEETRFQNNLIGYCKHRDIAINELFCRCCKKIQFGSPCCGAEMKKKKGIYDIPYYVCNTCHQRVNETKQLEHYQKELKKEKMFYEMLS